MFTDITVGNKPKDGIVLEAATFNFDVSDFSSMVHESDRSITATLNSYRTLMTQTLTESAGVMNEDTGLIMEQASEHIGQKIIKVLVAIRDWLVRTAKSIILKIQTLATSNKKLLTTVKPAVADKMKEADSPLKALKGEMHDYDLSVITVENVLGKWNDLFLSSEYDLRPDYTEANKEKLDAAAKKVAEIDRNEIVIRALRQMFKGPAKNLKEASVEAQKLLRKGGERKVVPFEMKYFDVVENFESVKEPIQKAFDGLIKEVDEMIKEINTNVKSSNADVKNKGKEGPDVDRAHTSGKVGYYNAKRKILAVSLETAVFLNNLKLQAAVEEMREARQFCVQAFHYKAVKEGAFAEPYAPYLDSNGGDSFNEAALNESNVEPVAPATW